MIIILENQVITEEMYSAKRIYCLKVELEVSSYEPLFLGTSNCVDVKFFFFFFAMCYFLHVDSYNTCILGSRPLFFVHYF